MNQEEITDKIAYLIENFDIIKELVEKQKSFPKPVNPWLGGQFKVSDFLNPTQVSPNTDEIMIECAGIHFWFSNSDVETILNACKEAACEYEDSGITLGVKADCVVDGAVRFNDNNSTNIEICGNAYINKPCKTITHEDLILLITQSAPLKNILIGKNRYDCI